MSRETSAPPGAPWLPRPLVLSGFMGAGKTTVGRAVAARTGAPFVDTDEALLRETSFATVAEAFTTLGEPAFRRLEATVLRRALDSNAASVIAVGGGALLLDSIRRPLLETAVVVTLTASPETLLRRTESPGAPGRPLLDSPGIEGSHAQSRLDRIESLLAARTPVYAESHATIATDGGRSMEEVVTAVLRAWQTPTLVVPLGARSYRVRFTGNEGAGAVVREILDATGCSSWAHVTDTNVRALHGARFLAGVTGSPPLASVTLPPGEREKHLGTVQHLLGVLLEAGVDRGAMLVAHGGGVVSDITGFTSAVLLRGVPWISVPTTLLSMADAAIGGKTGVDVGRAKNAAGAFHQPSAVIIDVRHVATEAPRAFRSGLSEIVKSAAIADPVLFALLESAAHQDSTVPPNPLPAPAAQAGGDYAVPSNPLSSLPVPAAGGDYAVPSNPLFSLPVPAAGGDYAVPSNPLFSLPVPAAGGDYAVPPNPLPSLPAPPTRGDYAVQSNPALLLSAVYRAAAVKVRIVSQDERESGPRALLNFGHTLGHALEAAGNFERWTHGEAVALGMIAAARVGRTLDLTPPPVVERLTALLGALGLPTDLRRADVEAALPYLSLDKKRRGTTLRAVFLTEIGCAILRDVPLMDLARLFTEASDRN